MIDTVESRKLAIASLSETELEAFGYVSVFLDPVEESDGRFGHQTMMTLKDKGLVRETRLRGKHWYYETPPYTDSDEDGELGE